MTICKSEYYGLKKQEDVLIVSNYINDQAYTGCIYCSQIQKNALGGREPCIFHKKEKNEALFWSLIRSQKPTNYNGFIFSPFEPYKFIDGTKKLAEAANFWDTGEEPVFNWDVCFYQCSFDNLNFLYTLFKNKIEFVHSTINNAVFSHSIFSENSPIEFKNNKIESLVFENCEQYSPQAYRIRGIEFSLNEIKKIKISKCDFIFVISFYNQKNINLTLIENKKISNIQIHNSEVDKLHSDSNNINSIVIFHSTIKMIELYNGTIMYFEMIGNHIEKLVLYSHFKSLEARNNILLNKFILIKSPINQLEPSILFLEDTIISKECVFTIKEFECSSLQIKSMNVFSDQVVFSNLKIESSFELINSNISKVQFNTVTMSLSCKTTIDGSNVADSIFNNLEWGKISNINANRDTFRQLKHANDKQSNYLASHQFYAREMEEYNKTIVNKNLEEKIVFLLGKYISNFSQSWITPLCWTIIVGIVMYLTTVLPTECLLVSSALIIPMLFIFFPKNEIYSYSFSNYLYTVTALFLIAFIFSSSNFNGLASFINPFGSFLKENPQHHYFIWLLHKIISSFTIYHFVVALRRSTQR